MAKPKVNKIFLLIDGELSTELLSRQTRLWESLWKVSGELDNSEAKLVAILYPPLPLPGEVFRLSRDLSLGYNFSYFIPGYR